MSRVNFEMVKARIESQRRGGAYEHEWARCDLALPAAELRAIAGVLDAVPWIEEAAEQDGALFVRPQYDVAWLTQERAFHAALAIVRTRVAAALRKLRTETPEETPEPVLINSYVSYPRCSHAHLAGGGATFVMPEGHYGAGFAVIEDDDGVVSGYFLGSDRYDDHRKPLATALLASLYPELGIATWHRLKSWGEVDMAADGRTVDRLLARNNLRDHGAACYREAINLIEGCRREIAALQWQGRPSAFLDEDDDARDWLLAEMRAGARVDRVRREDAGYNDADGICEFTLSDGTPLTHYIVTRLQNADAILPEGYPFEHRREPDAPLAPLVFNPKAHPDAIEPRLSCVPFQAFQSYCSFRRHDGDRECAHPTKGGDTCSANYCPLTTQVYSGDVGDYGLRFDDDPAFDYHEWERDSMVYAIHRNTERSFAWRAAGEDAVTAVVNTVLHAKYALGVDRHLFGSENMRAARQAVAQGHLVVDQEMPGFGVVLRPSDGLIARIEAARAQQEAQRQEAPVA